MKIVESMVRLFMIVQIGLRRDSPVIGSRMSQINVYLADKKVPSTGKVLIII